MKRLCAALLFLFASSPVAAHDGRAAEVFTFTSTEQAASGAVAAQPGARITAFEANLDYGDGHRESVAGQCSARDNPPGAAFSCCGACSAPGAYTMEFHCRAAGQAGSDCWGSLTGALEGHHNGLTGLITYRRDAEGGVGLGRWND